MHKKTIKWFTILVIVVAILFGIFMMLTVPEINFFQAEEEAEELQ